MKAQGKMQIITWDIYHTVCHLILQDRARGGLHEAYSNGISFSENLDRTEKLAFSNFQKHEWYYSIKSCWYYSKQMWKHVCHSCINCLLVKLNEYWDLYFKLHSLLRTKIYFRKIYFIIIPQMQLVELDVENLI